LDLQEKKMSTNKKLIQAWKNLDIALGKTADIGDDLEKSYGFLLEGRPTHPMSASNKGLSRPQSSYILRHSSKPMLALDNSKSFGKASMVNLGVSFMSGKHAPFAPFTNVRSPKAIAQLFSPKMKYNDESTVLHSVSVRDLKTIYEKKCVDTKNDFNPNQLNHFVDKFDKNCKKKTLDLEDQYIGPNATIEIANLVAENSHFIKLNLSKNAIGDYGAKCIAAALYENKSIIHVDLSNNGIGPEGAADLFSILTGNEYIASFKLNSVEGLNRNRIDAKGMRPLATALKENYVLQFLDISGSCITLEGFNYLAEGLSGNTSLVYLNISDNDIGPKIQNIIKPLMSCNLLELDISKNRLGDAGLQLLIGIFQPTAVPHSKIQTLNIGGNNITAFGATKLFDMLSKNNTVKKLILDNNNLTGRGISNIVGLLFENATLTSISLYDCNLNHEGADALGTGLSRNFHINTLILGKNPFKDEGIKILVSSLKENHMINVLDLSGCKIRDEGGKMIAELMSTNHNLIQVDLKDNHIRDGGGIAFLDAVRANKRVTKLNLVRNPTSYKYILEMERMIRSHKTGLVKESASSFAKEMEFLKEFETQKYAVAQEGRVLGAKHKELADELASHQSELHQREKALAAELELLEDEFAMLMEENRRAERERYNIEDQMVQAKAEMESQIHLIKFQTDNAYAEADEAQREIKKIKETSESAKAAYERTISKLKVELNDRERQVNALEATVTTTENQVNRIREEKNSKSPKNRRAGDKSPGNNDNSPSRARGSMSPKRNIVGGFSENQEDTIKLQPPVVANPVEKTVKKSPAKKGKGKGTKR